MSMVYHVSKRIFKDVGGKECTDDMLSIEDYTYLKYTHTLAFDFDAESGIMYVGYSKINQSGIDLSFEINNNKMEKIKIVHDVFSKKTGREIAIKHLEEIKRILPPSLGMYYIGKQEDLITIQADFINDESIVEDFTVPFYSISKGKTPTQFSKVIESIEYFLPRVLNKKRFAKANYGRSVTEIRIY